MIQKIVKNNNVLAIILRANYRSEGIKFFTPNEYSQQLGYMNRAKGYKIPPHIHNKVRRSVEFTNEVLLVKTGKVRVDFYDENKSYFKSELLHKGDVILLVKGGHGFEMIEKSEMIEIKQGPYLDDADKTHFTSVDKKKIKLNKDI
jgi:hypothetical protein